MSFLKKKVKIEDVAADLATKSLRRGIAFFERENQKSHYHLPLESDDLLHIGAGMLLFFLARKLPDDRASAEMMVRAYRNTRRKLAGFGGNGDKAHTWWTYFTDSSLFHKEMDPLTLVCRTVWQQTFPDAAFKGETALHAYAYFLSMEVDGAANAKIV